MPGLTARSWTASASVLVGLPLSAADAFDSGAAARGLLLPGDQDAVEWLLALPLRSPDLLLTLATSGSAPRFRAERVGATDFLHSLSGGAPPLALSGPFLVCAPSLAVLQRAALFVADPRATLFQADHGGKLTGAVSGSAALRLVEATLARIEPATRELLQTLLPDWSADRRAVASAELPVSASIGDERAQVSLSLPVLELGGAALLARSGGISKLLEGHRDATLGVCFQSATLQRSAAAERALGFLLPTDSQRLELVGELAALSAARGPWTRAFAERGTNGLLLYGSMDLEDEDGAQKALDALVATTREGIATRLGVELRGKSSVLTRIGAVTWLHLERVERQGTEEPKRTRVASVVLRVSGNRLALAAGADVVTALGKALGVEPEDGPPTLAGIGEVAAAVRALPDELSCVGFVDVVRALSTARPRGEPTLQRSGLALGWGPTPTAHGLHLSADSRALAELISSRVRSVH